MNKTVEIQTRRKTVYGKLYHFINTINRICQEICDNKLVFLKNSLKNSNYINERFENFFNEHEEFKINSGIININRTNEFLLTSNDKIFDLTNSNKETFVLDFLAHLRIQNNLEKFKLRNGLPLENVKWKFFKSDKDFDLVTINSIYFGYERHERITYSFQSSIPRWNEIIRNVRVEPLLRGFINIKEAEIGSLEPDQICLWFHLFGCEAKKNPAAFIHHCMLFDLIIYNIIHDIIKDIINEIINENIDTNSNYDSKNWDWSVLGCFGKVPMMQKGAIQEALKLDATYKEFMPIRYEYQDNVDINTYNVDYTTLVNRETKIFKDWLTLKNIIIDENETNEEKISKLESALQESFKRWGFPI